MLNVCCISLRIKYEKSCREIICIIISFIIEVVNYWKSMGYINFYLFVKRIVINVCWRKDCLICKRSGRKRRLGLWGFVLFR